MRQVAAAVGAADMTSPGSGSGSGHDAIQAGRTPVKGEVVSMFRRVGLPGGVNGGLWLHGMPGRNEPLERAWAQIRVDGIQTILCLAGSDEVRAKSPSYAAALDAKSTPCSVEAFPIPDFGVPDACQSFWGLALDIAAQLKSGRRILIHCGAGVGRTGTLATCILLALGQSRLDAQTVVSTAGSGPETPEQTALVAWCAARASAAS